MPKTLCTRYRKSEEMYERACRIIPGGSQTLSKRPDPGLRGIHPIFFERGRGSHVWDVDGNEFIDYVLALGPMTLGYCYPRVQQAVKKQLDKGTIFSGPHPLEVEVAEKMIEMIPCAEMVRFGKNGVDATAALVRIARTYTGRDLIVHHGYHGWHNWYMAERKEPGIPVAYQSLIYRFEYGDLASLEKIMDQHGENVAIVLMEPCHGEDPPPGFLESCREIAHKHGAVFAFDEVVTGFRLANGGAQERYGVTPDLAAFGKALANGHPISAFLGKKEIMQAGTPMTCSMTFGGECSSLAAASATISVYRDEPVVEHIFAMGERLKEGVKRAFERSGIAGETKGLGPMSQINLLEPDDKLRREMLRFLMQETAKRGVYTRPTYAKLISYSHSEEDIDHTIAVFEESLTLLKDALDKGDLEDRIETEASGDTEVIPSMRQLMRT